MPRVLIVEDEVAIAETLLYALGGEGFQAQWTRLGGEAVALLRQPDGEPPIDLVILDVGLPDMTGFETCKAIRQFSEVPVIFLTARAGEVDRVVGLEIGADDYVIKPFSPREVAARVRAVLKRSRSPAGAAGPSPNGEFQVDTSRASISYRGQPLRLTPHEFRLLQALLEQPERVLSRERLLAVLGLPADAGYERNIDGHIRSLRAKLREISPDHEPIQTHRGFGYSYSPDAVT